jgi:eukaryotic-like serine/threonine-protein kinase
VGFGDWLKNLFAGKKKGGGGTAKKTAKTPRVDVKKRFDLLNRTGQGSMSKVWRARDNKLGRMICLKLLDKAKTAHFEARFKGLQRPGEGAICVTLHHKNIVQTFEHGVTTDGEQYLVMELIDGMGLNYLVETKSPDLIGNRINLLIQIADGLEYLHQQQFLHRDICPRNIMVNREGVAKLIDFGLAIPNHGEFLRPGNRTGTPNYLAPEIIRRSATDSRVDMFALGVTAYEVFTYTLPWEKAQSLQTLLSHMNSPGRDPREIVPDIDQPTRAFLIKCIERDREARYQTPAEFRDGLRRLPKQDW